MVQIEIPAPTEARFHSLVKEMHLQESSVLQEAFQKLMAHLEDMYRHGKYK